MIRLIDFSVPCGTRLLYNTGVSSIHNIMVLQLISTLCLAGEFEVQKEAT